VFTQIDSSIPADQRPPIVEQNGGKSMMGTFDFIKIGSTVEVRIDDLCDFLIKRKW
jgi:hypothetical protein